MSPISVCGAPYGASRSTRGCWVGEQPFLLSHPQPPKTRALTGHCIPRPWGIPSSYIYILGNCVPHVKDRVVSTVEYQDPAMLWHGRGVPSSPSAFHFCPSQRIISLS